jgi:hypothetical protein
MVHGVLTVNLDPPYYAFDQQEPSDAYVGFLSCSLDELQALLLDLGALAPGQPWPPKDYIARIKGDFSLEELSRWGLFPTCVEPLTNPDELMLEEAGKVSNLLGAMV